MTRSSKKPRELTLHELRVALGMSQQQLADETGYSVRQISRWDNGIGEARYGIMQFLRNQLPKKPSREASFFTFAELYAGIGGFRRGFEAAGGYCVFASEKDKYAQVTYRANYGEAGLHGDIARLKAEKIPDHDILLASFRCDPFPSPVASVKNTKPSRDKSAPDPETKGTEFYHIERVLEAKRPRAFVLETAKALAEHDKGRTWKTIRRVLEKKLGYRISMRVVDAKSWLPLYRERAYIVGVRPDVGAAFDWNKVDIPDPDWGPTLGFIVHEQQGPVDAEQPYTDDWGRVLPKYTLTDDLWKFLKAGGARQQATKKEAPEPQDEQIGYARSFSPQYRKDGSEILIWQRRKNPRKLTPRECARLMGFDTRHEERPFRIMVSDTQAYRQFGGATAVPVAEAIAKVLAPRVVASMKVAAKQRTRAGKK